MATKKPATKKPAVKAKAKPAAKGADKKGTKYSCDVCGMVVSVDTVCGCEEVDLLCCGEPMSVKK